MAADDFHLGQWLTVIGPHRVGAGGELGVHAHDDVPVDDAPPADHGVDVMAPGGADGGQIDFGPQRFLTGIEQERPDIAADVQ